MELDQLSISWDFQLTFTHKGNELKFETPYFEFFLNYQQHKVGISATNYFFPYIYLFYYISYSYS